MKRLFACTLLMPLVVFAAPRDDYAWQWPVTASQSDAGAYRVVLDETVYRRVRTPELRDLAVLDRDGAPIPASLLASEAPRESASRLALPWFTLPAAPEGGTGREWALVSEADADGRLRRVDVRSGDGTRVPPRTTLLLDASRVDAPLAALELQWRPGDAIDIGYRVEASDDLEHWRPVATRGRLVDLQQNGQRLLQRRIELVDATAARYLRLIPGRGDAALDITGVTAELAPAAPVSAPQWIALAPRDGTSGGTMFEYELDGRFPVQQVDVALPGNHAVEWWLESRDAPDAPWRARVAPWVAYSIGSGDAGSRSPPRVLGQVVRDRYWRLHAGTPAAAMPTLQLGYRPESVVFVAQGAAPYSLVAGSARARRADAPVTVLVAALHSEHGDRWQPATATLGSAQTLAGEAALRPARDWKAWLLWGVLCVGAIAVAGFAASLLREPRPVQG
jgi:hypothetical protein